MWCYGKLLKTSWIDKVTHEEVLNSVKEQRSLYSKIKGHRNRLIKHTLIHEELEGTILEGISSM